jgi:hypothetical protein
VPLIDAVSVRKVPPVSRTGPDHQETPGASKKWRNLIKKMILSIICYLLIKIKWILLLITPGACGSVLERPGQAQTIQGQQLQAIGREI